MKPNYCAVIGDINKSRALERRGAVQKKFEAAIQTINKEFKNEIASKFLVTIGDEFQGLLVSPAKSYHLIRRFEEIMSGVSFSFGVGIGTLATEIKSENAIGMDGECFYHAREALHYAKRKKVTLVYRFADRAEPLVNALVAILNKQWSRIGKRQKQIITKLQADMTQAEIARSLRISQQGVSKAIRSKSLHEMNQSVEALDAFFASYRGHQ